MAKRKLAAVEINKALKQNGNYRLVFVCTVEAGRVRTDDVTTIQTVLEAVEDDKFPYGILLNKASERIVTAYNSDDTANQSLQVCLNYGHRPTDQIFLYPFDRQLEDADDKVVEPRADFLEFLDGMKAKVLKPEQVKTIEIEKFEEMKQEFEQEIARLQNNSACMQQEADKQKKWLAALASVAGVVAASAIAGIALKR